MRQRIQDLDLLFEQDSLSDQSKYSILDMRSKLDTAKIEFISETAYGKNKLAVKILKDLLFPAQDLIKKCLSELKQDSINRQSEKGTQQTAIKNALGPVDNWLVAFKKRGIEIKSTIIRGE